MTVNGWLQILVFLAVVAAVTPPIGAYMARVFERERTWLDPVPRPIERLIYRLTRVDESRDMRWTDVRRGAAAVQRDLDASALCHATRAGAPALEPAAIAGCARSARLQHRRVVHHQHELAGIQRRIDHELLHADGRARVPQLRVGRSGNRRCDCLHSRYRSQRAGHHRQLLGRSRTEPRCGSSRRSASSLRSPSYRRGSSRISGRTTRCRRWRAGRR